MVQLNESEKYGLDLAETPSATPLASLNGGGDWAFSGNLVDSGDGAWLEMRVTKETRRRREIMVAVVK